MWECEGLGRGCGIVGGEGVSKCGEGVRVWGEGEAVSSCIYDPQCINMLPHHHTPLPFPHTSPSHPSHTHPPPIPPTHTHLHSQDQNDISPQFPETQYNATIPEDIPSGSIVTQVSPIDQSAFRMCVQSSFHCFQPYMHVYSSQ